MLDNGTLDSPLVGRPVEFAVLRPGDGPSVDLPIMLWLHGGGGSARFLETCQPQFAAAWNSSALPDVAVVTPSAGWSYYLDQKNGGEQWESFLLDDLIPHVRKQTGSSDGPLVVGGVSVGGLAALRIAFRRPELVAAVVAIEPTIAEGMAYADVPARDRVQIPDSVRSRLWGDPVDDAYWQANHPLALAADNASAIAGSETAIYLECGDDDRFHAHYGVESLHRLLFDIGVDHEYRLVRGGNHVGPTVGPRILDGLQFVGRVLGERNGPAVEPDAEVAAFADRVAELEVSAGYRHRVQVQGPEVSIAVEVQGEGPTIIFLPSLGRGAADFAQLADRIAPAGYRTLRPHPRGTDETPAPLDGVTLDHFADDAAAVIDAFGGPATIVGHDFGGQVAQLVAFRYPELVSSLVLMATPGPVQPKPEPATALRRIFVPELSSAEHREAVALALFADDSDPSAWDDGWHLPLAFAEAEAERHVPIEELWSKLRTEALVLQPANDLIVLPENAELMRSQLPSLVTVLEIAGAGHALLPEQPEAVAAAILSWLDARR